MVWTIGGSSPGRGWEISPHRRVQSGSGAHITSYPMDNMGSVLAVKRQGREADHSPPSSAEVKNAWSYTSTSPICFHGVEQHRDKFTFYFFRMSLTYRNKIIIIIIIITATQESVQGVGRRFLD
jgi:hypothetical protein